MDISEYNFLIMSRCSCTLLISEKLLYKFSENAIKKKAITNDQKSHKFLGTVILLQSVYYIYAKTEFV